MHSFSTKPFKQNNAEKWTLFLRLLSFFSCKFTEKKLQISAEFELGSSE